MTYGRRGFRISKDTPLLDRLYFNISVNLETRCWEWLGNVIPNGYGQLRVGRCKQDYAHRVSYELFVEPIADGLQVDHLCRNRRCVNPEHLEAVTSGENTRRGHAARAA